MEPTLLDELKTQIKSLSTEDQDHLASMLLMERLKRNKLIMPTLHKRVDDADPVNWKAMEQDTIFK